MPLNVADSKQRTALPLLFLLSYPQLNPGGVILPGIPIRRPQDELLVTQKPMSQLSDELPQNLQNDDANSMIREQFIQGILQGLQSMSSNGGATLNPAVLADFLEQVNAVATTVAPKITPPPTVEKDAQVIDDNEADYDYIDFKNGSRIKYDLDNDQQSSDDVEYPNKILFEPQFVGYLRSQQQQHAI